VVTTIYPFYAKFGLAERDVLFTESVFFSCIFNFSQHVLVYSCAMENMIFSTCELVFTSAFKCFCCRNV